MSSNLHELYDSYNGDWRLFFSEVSKFWTERAMALTPKFQQPFLLGCPWCGVVPEVRKMPAISPDTFAVDCRNRVCPRRVISAKTPEEAASQWNIRADLSTTTNQTG